MCCDGCYEQGQQIATRRAAAIRCDICGAPATTSDGIVGAELCDNIACLDAAWDRAYPEREGSS